MSAGCGGCFILVRKFSARSFWRDCHLSRATKILYVGELCRYLLATPEGEYDKKHLVRMAAGNGMRAEVWDKFKNRFNIPVISEYYRSTEVRLYIGCADDRELQGMIIYKRVMAYGDQVVLGIVDHLGDSSKTRLTS